MARTKGSVTPNFKINKGMATNKLEPIKANKNGITDMFITLAMFIPYVYFTLTTSHLQPFCIKYFQENRFAITFRRFSVVGISF